MAALVAAAFESRGRGRGRETLQSMPRCSKRHLRSPWSLLVESRRLPIVSIRCDRLRQALGVNYCWPRVHTISLRRPFLTSDSFSLFVLSSPVLSFSQTLQSSLRIVVTTRSYWILRHESSRHFTRLAPHISTRLPGPALHRQS